MIEWRGHGSKRDQIYECLRHTGAHLRRVQQGGGLARQRHKRGQRLGPAKGVEADWEGFGQRI